MRRSFAQMLEPWAASRSVSLHRGLPDGERALRMLEGIGSTTRPSGQWNNQVIVLLERISGASARSGMSWNDVVKDLIGKAAAAGGGVTLAEVVAGDFDSLNAFKDLNSIENAALSIAAGGLVTFDTLRVASLSDGLGEMAVYRMNWPSSYVGDGTRGLLWKLTPQSAADFEDMIFCAGVCDRGGDPTNALAVCGWGGVISNPASTWRIAIGDRTDKTGAESDTAQQAVSPKIYIWWRPNGDVGDDTSTGASFGQFGSLTPYMRTVPFAGSGSRGFNVDAVTRDGLWPVLAVGVDSAGAGENDVTQWKVEFGTFDCAPEGTFV